MTKEYFIGISPTLLRFKKLRKVFFAVFSSEATISFKLSFIEKTDYAIQSFHLKW